MAENQSQAAGGKSELRHLCGSSQKQKSLIWQTLESPSFFFLKWRETERKSKIELRHLECPTFSVLDDFHFAFYCSTRPQKN